MLESLLVSRSPAPQRTRRRAEQNSPQRTQRTQRTQRREDEDDERSPSLFLPLPLSLSPPTSTASSVLVDASRAVLGMGSWSARAYPFFSWKRILARASNGTHPVGVPESGNSSTLLREETAMPGRNYVTR